MPGQIPAATHMHCIFGGNVFVCLLVCNYRDEEAENLTHDKPLSSRSTKFCIINILLMLMWNFSCILVGK